MSVVIWITLRIQGKHDKGIKKLDEVIPESQSGVPPSPNLPNTLLVRQLMERTASDQHWPCAKNKRQALEGKPQVVGHSPGLLQHEISDGVGERPHTFLREPTSLAND
jgi:hypothetical protein